MRIDIGSNSLRPDLMPNKTNADTYEINSRGENIRGRVIDVNQNIVLIQTSTGREFTANTTFPMENFIGEEMLFNVVYNSDGQMFLKPELNEKEKAMIESIKIEDILLKLGKQLTTENKQLAVQMIKAGIPLSPENFKELKEASLSLKIISQNLPKEYSEEENKMPIQLLLKQIKSSNNEQSSFTNTNLKTSELFSEKLGVSTTLNKTVLNEISSENENIQSLRNKATENTEYLNNKNINTLKNIESLDTLKNIQTLKNKDSQDLIKVDKSDISSKNMLKDIITIKLLDQPVNIQNLKALNQLNNIINSNKLDITGFKGALETIRQENPDLKFSDEQVRTLITNIQSEMSKKINPQNKITSEDLNIDYAKVQEEVKKFIDVLSNKADIKTKIFEDEVLPKINLLKEMEKHLNYNVLSFNINKYQNKAEYYLKKRNSNKDSTDKGTQVAFSINTYNVGNIKALLTQKSPGQITVNISSENKIYKQKIDLALPLLESGLKSSGFKSVIVSSMIDSLKQETPLEDVVYKNKENKSFETWV